MNKLNVSQWLDVCPPDGRANDPTQTISAYRSVQMKQSLKIHQTDQPHLMGGLAGSRNQQEAAGY
ncbi:MAG: hypothetical protein CMJ70_01005 [Planctomycetaceae bacterium]|nr:hypothetical protein [Planctomycetaceae bacterium]HAA70601.1 hypothetical protein [Planctomycetaceae bacterium]